MGVLQYEEKNIPHLHIVQSGKWLKEVFSRMLRVKTQDIHWVSFSKKRFCISVLVCEAISWFNNKKVQLRWITLCLSSGSYAWRVNLWTMLWSLCWDVDRNPSDVLPCYLVFFWPQGTSTSLEIYFICFDVLCYKDKIIRNREDGLELCFRQGCCESPSNYI